jgi:4-amino-4-deoxy-L-arabinose transferase-like glycosyltransferase
MFARASTQSPPRLKLLLAIIILGAAGLYLLGNGRVSLWDRDEPRYAQCARQMLEGFPGPKGAHGPDLAVPHFLDDLRTEKPPLIYWCQAGSMSLFGQNTFAARLPSAVGMTLVLALLATLLYRTVGPVRATWAVFTLATSALTIMSAKMCLTDAVLLLWIVIAQACVYGVYRGNRSWAVTIILWSALGLGGLTKGPIVLAVIGVTMVALLILDVIPARHAEAGAAGDRPGPSPPSSSGSTFANPIRWWAGLRPWAGLPILAAIAGPWLLIVHHRAPTFLPRIFAAAERHLAASHEKHVAPPGYYLTMIWGLLFPWSLLLPTTLAIGWRNRHLPIIRFCLATVLGVWVFQEIMKTKLPFYMLPIFPALALLTADALTRCLRGEHDDLLRPAFLIAVIIWTIAAIGLGAAPWLIVLLPKLNLAALAPKPATATITIAAAAYALAVFYFFKSRRLSAAAITMGIGTVILFAILFGAYLPHADYLRTSDRIAAILSRQPLKPGDALMIDYKEPSLAFDLHGLILEERDSRFLDKTAPEHWPRYVVLPKSQWDKTSAAAKAQLRVLAGPIHGLSYAGKIDGQQVVDVMVVEKAKAVPSLAPEPQERPERPAAGGGHVR